MREIKLAEPKVLSPNDILSKLISYFTKIELSGKRVLIICEDVTRSTPIHLFFPDFWRFLQAKAQSIAVIFALGTHRPMTEKEMLEKLGISPAEARHIKLINHNAFDDSILLEVGTVESVPIKVHSSVSDRDLTITLGSVFPHRVVGFSGGTKYLCPGIANKAIIDYTHWKSNLFPEDGIVGKIENPIREILNEIAELVMTKFPANYVSVNCVTTPLGIVNLFIGDFYNSYRQAAQLSAKFFFKPVEECSSILAIVDDKSVDFWQAAKAVYNCGSVIKDGGCIVVRGKLEDGISSTHGRVIETIGYSAPERIYELVASGEFQDNVVASHMIRVGQHLKRIRIVLSSENLDEQICDRVNLGYLNPSQIDESEFDCVVYNATDLILTKA